MPIRLTPELAANILRSQDLLNPFTLHAEDTAGTGTTIKTVYTLIFNFNSNPPSSEQQGLNLNRITFKDVVPDRHFLRIPEAFLMQGARPKEHVVTTIIQATYDFFGAISQPFKNHVDQRCGQSGICDSCEDRFAAQAELADTFLDEAKKETDSTLRDKLNQAEQITRVCIVARSLLCPSSGSSTPAPSSRAGSRPGSTHVFPPASKPATPDPFETFLPIKA